MEQRISFWSGPLYLSGFEKMAQYPKGSFAALKMTEAVLGSGNPRHGYEFFPHLRKQQLFDQFGF